MEFLNFIHCQRYRTSIRFQALVHEGINTDPETMIRIALLLPWCEFGRYDKSRDAQWLARAFFNNRCGFDKPANDCASSRFPFPVHGFYAGKLFLAMEIFRE